MALALASSRLKPVLRNRPEVSEIEHELDCGTGFSRESVRRHAAKVIALALACSRLKPVL